MKKIFYAIPSLVIMSLMLVSCKESEENNDDTKEIDYTVTSEEYTKALDDFKTAEKVTIDGYCYMETTSETEEYFSFEQYLSVAFDYQKDIIYYSNSSYESDGDFNSNKNWVYTDGGTLYKTEVGQELAINEEAGEYEIEEYGFITSDTINNSEAFLSIFGVNCGPIFDISYDELEFDSKNNNYKTDYLYEQTGLVIDVNCWFEDNSLVKMSLSGDSNIDGEQTTSSMEFDFKYDANINMPDFIVDEAEFSSAVSTFDKTEKTTINIEGLLFRSLYINHSKDSLSVDNMTWVHKKDDGYYRITEEYSSQDDMYVYEETKDIKDYSESGLSSDASKRSNFKLLGIEDFKEIEFSDLTYDENEKAYCTSDGIAFIFIDGELCGIIYSELMSVYAICYDSNVIIPEIK